MTHRREISFESILGSNGENSQETRAHGRSSFGLDGEGLALNGLDVDLHAERDSAKPEMTAGIGPDAKRAPKTKTAVFCNLAS